MFVSFFLGGGTFFPVQLHSGGGNFLSVLSLLYLGAVFRWPLLIDCVSPPFGTVS